VLSYSGKLEEGRIDARLEKDEWLTITWICKAVNIDNQPLLTTLHCDLFNSFDQQNERETSHDMDKIMWPQSILDSRYV
jgi:hypothetical protein